MNNRFQIAAAPADVELAAYARRCLLLRLQHRNDRGGRIDAELVDAAGRVPRNDGCCIVSVKRHGWPAAAVVDVGANAHLAIDRAADRAAHLVARRLRQAGSPQASRTEAVAA